MEKDTLLNADLLERQITEMQDMLLRGFDARSLAWLSLVPGWTLELAKACEFPIPYSQSMDGFLERITAALLVKTESHDNQLDFWMPVGMRSTVSDYLSRQRGKDFLLSEASKAGQRIDKMAQSGELDVSLPLRQWSGLASRMTIIHDQQDLHLASDWLNRQATELIDQGRTGELVTWLETIKPLVELAGGELEAAARLCQRQLELVYRRRQDERHVKGFLRRSAQVKAFVNLLNNQNGVWALHYLGMGGVGKTMLLRYISAGLPFEPDGKRLPIISCRIDFDFISPNYPMRLPGQLLQELVAELRYYISNPRRISSFSSQVTSLHEAMSGGPAVADLQARLETDEKLGKLFDGMVQAFARLLFEVAKPGQPVILILDTCEELAKFQPLGGRLPAIEATFLILEKVYAACCQQMESDPKAYQDLPFRVIFSGRRLLAQRGFDWRIKRGQAGNVGSKRRLLPQEKTYLSLFELRGFDRKEAQLYLYQKKGLSQISPELFEAILSHSQDTGRSSEIKYRSGTSIYKPGIERYNPFDLSLYAGWIEAEPNLSEKQITSDAQDPYVHFRILERLHITSLEDLLPALALLGRFDESILRPLLASLKESDIDDILRDLGDQEWIDYRFDENLKTRFMVIDTNLLPRLRRYYGIEPGIKVDADRSRHYERARQQLGPIMKDLIVGNSNLPSAERHSCRLDQVTVEYLDATLRCLPDLDAAAFWQEIERRIPSEAGWGWAMNVIPSLLGQGHAVNDTSHVLWAALNATYTAAQLHTWPGNSLGPLWEDVSRTAVLHPIKETREWLSRRAILGQAANHSYLDTPLPAEQVTSLQQTILDGTDYYTGSFFWNEGGPYTELYAWQFIASACALLSNLLDTAEYHNASSNLDPARLQNWVDNLEKAHFPASLVAIAGCVAGRLWAISGDRSQAAITFAHAIQIAQVIPPPGFPDAYDSQAWSDWSGPPDLLTRLQLEAASFLPGSLSSEQQSILIDWRKGILENGLVVTGRPEVEIERERLLSILLQAGLERQPPDLSEIEEIHKILNYNHQRQPTCFSHLRIPPLALTLGRAYLALGISSQAIELFLEHKNAALSAGGDDPTVRAMQIGMSEAVRRFRLFSQWPILCEDAIDPPYTTVWREAWVAGILSGNLRPENWQGPSDFWLRHFWDWNQRLGRSNSQQDAISQVTLSPSWRLESMSYSDVLVWLDAVAGSPTKPDQAFDPVAWLKNHPQKPENALHLALLANGTHTLAKSRDEGDVGVLRLPRSIVEAVPPRLRADITSQEAELLALQNPMEAAALFDQAIDWYKEALDPCGAWLAALGMSLCTTHLTRRAEEINAKSLNQLLKDYYLAFASQAPYSLPDWERLADFANLSESDGDKLLTNPTWGDWWVRLLVILSNQKQEAWIDAPKNQILHQRLLGRYGNNLPIELSFAPIQVDVVTADNIVGDETIAHVEAIPAPGSGCANSLARLLRSSAQLLGLGLIVIAVIAGILALLYLGFNYVISKLGLPSSIGFWPRLAMLLSTLGIGGLLVYLRALPRKLYDVTLGAWVASKSRLSWLIQRSSDKSEGSLLHLNADIAAWSWKPPFYKLVPSQWDWSQFASQAPQKTIDDKLPDEARQVLLSLKSRLRNRSVPLPLTAESYELLSPNWEKYLSFAIDSANLITTLDHLQVYRSLSSTKPRSLASAQTAWRQGMVRIVCSPSTNRIIENSWPKRAGHLVSTPDLPNEKDFQYKILHLVGMPLMTSSGLVWQVSSLTQEEEIYQTKSFDTAGRAGALLSVDQLPLESIAVIVLQLEPTFDPSPFTNIYDEQMRLARQFAARLLSVGAVQALVIPALPSILVPQVINALAKILLVSQLPQLAHMLSALQSVRKAIASGAAFPEKNRSDSIDTSSQAVSDYQQSSEERRALLALETCLFCAGEQRIAA